MIDTIRHSSVESAHRLLVTGLGVYALRIAAASAWHAPRPVTIILATIAGLMLVVAYALIARQWADHAANMTDATLMAATIILGALTGDIATELAATTFTAGVTDLIQRRTNK